MFGRPRALANWTMVGVAVNPEPGNDPASRDVQLTAESTDWSVGKGAHVPSDGFELRISVKNGQQELRRDQYDDDHFHQLRSRDLTLRVQHDVRVAKNLEFSVYSPAPS